MAKTSAEIMQMLVDNNVKFVDLRFTDFKGKEQHVSVPVSAFDEDKFEEGHAFDGSSIAGWKGIEASDMLLMPENFEEAYQGVLDAVADGTVSEERINDSLRRIYRVKLRSRVL